MRIRNVILVAAAATALAACGGDDNNTINNGTTNGAPNGATNGTPNGTTNGATNGTPNGTTNGTPNGTTNGATNGATNNSAMGNPLTCNGDFGAADACGGDPVGVWTVTEGCTNYDYEAAIQDVCANATVSDAVIDLTGTLSVNAATWTQAVSGTVTVTMSTPDGCGLGQCGLVEAGLGVIAPGATCTAGAVGGCDCTASLDAADVSTGTYTTDAGVATLGTGETYYYCVSGGTLLLREFGTATDDAEPTVLYSGS